jgi:hypothetical protein
MGVIPAAHSRHTRGGKLPLPSPRRPSETSSLHRASSKRTGVERESGGVVELDEQAVREALRALREVLPDRQLAHDGDALAERLELAESRLDRLGRGIRAPSRAVSGRESERRRRRVRVASLMENRARILEFRRAIAAREQFSGRKHAAELHPHPPHKYTSPPFTNAPLKPDHMDEHFLRVSEEVFQGDSGVSRGAGATRKTLGCAVKTACRRTHNFLEESVS